MESLLAEWSIKLMTIISVSSDGVHFSEFDADPTQSL